MMLRSGGICFSWLAWIFLVVYSWGAPTVFMMRLVELNGNSFCFGFLVDETSITFSGVVLLVTLSVYLYSLGYMGSDGMSKKFYGILSVFVGSMILLIFSGDLVSMFLAWEGLGLSSFLLVVYYSNSESASSGTITMLSNRLGDMCFLLGLSLMLSSGQLYFFCGEMGSSGFFFLACVAKSAQWPLCGWLPAAMAAPTPVSALVHSSTLVTAGGYLLLRLEGLESAVVGHVLVIPVLTMTLASLSALVSYDLKRAVAMSTLSHMAFVVWSILAGYMGLAFFHLLSHALFKSLLFLCAGVFIEGVGHAQDIRLMGGLFLDQPLVSVGLIYSLMNMMGVPFLSGYLSKEAIGGSLILISVQGEEILFFLGSLSLVLGVGYSVRLLSMLLYARKVSWVSWHNASGEMCYPIMGLMMAGLFLVDFGSCLSGLGFEVPGMVNSVFSLGLLFAGVIFIEPFWMCESWDSFYKLGHLELMSSGLSSGALMSSLVFVQNLEAGWFESMGGEGILYNSMSLQQVINFKEW